MSIQKALSGATNQIIGAEISAQTRIQNEQAKALAQAEQEAQAKADTDKAKAEAQFKQDFMNRMALKNEAMEMKQRKLADEVARGVYKGPYDSSVAFYANQRLKQIEKQKANQKNRLKIAKEKKKLQAYAKKEGAE